MKTLAALKAASDMSASNRGLDVIDFPAPAPVEHEQLLVVLGHRRPMRDADLRSNARGRQSILVFVRQNNVSEPNLKDAASGRPRWEERMHTTVMPAFSSRR